MFEKFTSEGSRDFQQRYQGTYGFFRDIVGGKEVKTLTQLSRIVTDASPPYIEFKGQDDRLFYIRADSKVEGRGFEFIPPKSSYYNTREGVPLLVERIPARQYLRGVCDRNTAIRDMNATVYAVDFNNVAKLFNEQVSIPDALKAMEGARKTMPGAGIAISDQFAVSVIYNRIKVFNATIGTCEYKDNVFHVVLEDPSMWLTEVTDAFRRAKLEATVQ